jgi:4-hydroxy-3-polyprenylbenzoate decarboxylase
MPERLVVGISGASGVIYGIRLLEVLRDVLKVETHLVITTAARQTISQETDWAVKDIEALAHTHYGNNEIGATIASGSFTTRGMVIIPCSIKTLSAVAQSFSGELISRAADVTLKERRPLILVVRETPFHLGHLRLMTQVTEMGGLIFPPLPAFYMRPKAIDDIVNNTVGRVLARLGFDNDLFKEWAGLR